MNEQLPWVLALVAGGGLGALFFGGLWWTVQKGVSSRLPALWFSGSLLLRLSVAVTGFYFISGSHWQRLLACLLGFFLARRVVTAMTRPSAARPCGDSDNRPAREASHAPES